MFEKIKKYEKGELLKQSIQELRTLGRGIGISSPTMYSKEDLVDLIVAKLMGEKVPEIDETRGRPSREDFVYGFTPNGYREFSKVRVASYVQPYIVNTLVKQGIINITLKGDLELVNCNFDIDKSVVMPIENSASINGIRKGDKVSYTKDDNGKINVLAINGVFGFNMIDRPDFNSFKIVKPSSVFNVNNAINKVAPICKGSRTIFCSQFSWVGSFADEVVQCLSQNQRNVQKMILLVDAKIEEINEVQRVGDVCLNVLTTEADEIIESEIALFIEHIKRMVELGQDILIYLPNNMELDNLLEDKKNIIKEVIKKIGMLSGNYVNNSSVTVIGVASSEIMLKTFTNLVTNIIKVIEVCGKHILDVENCETLFMEKFLRLDHIDEINKIKANWHTLSDEEKIELLEN